MVFTNDEIIVVYYVDDIVMFSKRKPAISNGEEKLGKYFTIRYFGESAHFPVRKLIADIGINFFSDKAC